MQFHVRDEGFVAKYGTYLFMILRKILICIKLVANSRIIVEFGLVGLLLRNFQQKRLLKSCAIFESALKNWPRLIDCGSRGTTINQSLLFSSFSLPSLATHKSNFPFQEYIDTVSKVLEGLVLKETAMVYKFVKISEIILERRMIDSSIDPLIAYFFSWFEKSYNLLDGGQLFFRNISLNH